MRILTKGSEVASALFHPTRIRIVSLIEAHPCTAADIAHDLSDVSTASLYRHLNVLVEAGLARVENAPTGRPGPAERTYVADRRATTLTNEQVVRLSKHSLRRHFQTFIMSVLGEFARYTEKRGFDLAADGVRFRKIALKLGDARHRVFLAELDALLERYDSAPDADGRIRSFTHISVPRTHLPEEER